MNGFERENDNGKGGERRVSDESGGAIRIIIRHRASRYKVGLPYPQVFKRFLFSVLKSGGF